MKAAARTPRAAPRRCDAAYYQRLHEASPKYRQSNWLLDDLPRLAAWPCRSIVEIGCGNGLFLERAAAHWDDVTGVDWACSPVLAAVLAAQPRIRFVQQDLGGWIPDRRWDLLVSADLLEHLPPATLGGVIAHASRAATLAFHKIACYDDGHSHLSLLAPEAWLALFEAAAPGRGFRIVRIEHRRPPRKKTVAVISNAGGSA